MVRGLYIVTYLVKRDTNERTMIEGDNCMCVGTCGAAERVEK
jgi:hypothetical protein